MVATVEASLLDSELSELVERLVARAVNEDARVEAVWPAYVWGGRELFALEEFVAVLQDLRQKNYVNVHAVSGHSDFTYQCVGIEEDALLELQQSPAVQFGECNAQFGTRQQRQISGVFRVQNVNRFDDIVDVLQSLAHGLRDARRDEHGQLVDGVNALQRVRDDQRAQSV